MVGKIQVGREVARVEGRQVKWLEDKPIDRQASWAKVVNRQLLIGRLRCIIVRESGIQKGRTCRLCAWQAGRWACRKEASYSTL